ncbi:MAG: B12-binding domain-containing radical SAM protein [Candidatus Aminicenantia bacterium]
MKLKLLLVNPWIADFTAYDLWIRPLGLLYIASILLKWDVAEIQFINCIDNFHPSVPQKFKKKRADSTSRLFSFDIEKPEILKIIPRKFKLFGIPIDAFENELEKVGKVDGVFMTSFMTYWYPGVQIAIERIRKKLGSIPVILGGIYPTLLPEHAKKNSGADFVIQGEAENQIGKILKEIFGVKKDFENFKDLDSIPFPEYRLLRDKDSLPFLTSRGCPFRCSYCASFIVSGKFRERSVKNCIKELQLVKNSFKTNHIAFYDDALLFNSESRIEPLLRSVIEKSLNFNFHTPNGLSIKEINRELAFLMKKANFKTIRLSLESVSKNFLLKTKSEHKFGDLKRVVVFFEEAGFRSYELEVYILVGLPLQEMEEVEESVRYAGECGVRVRFAYFSPIPKTEEWIKMEEAGLISSYDDPLLHNKVLFPYLWSKISPEKLAYLKELQRKVNERVLYR